MLKRKLRYSIILGVLLALSLVLFAGCGAADSGDPEYEAKTVEIVAAGETEGESISIAELRALPQHTLEASYKRTTGLYEEYTMEGPYVSEVFEAVGLKLADYAAIGVQGSDGYYCLITKEVIDATPDLMLALVVDGKAKLSEEEAPVRLAVQGQYGPYWVKKIDKITLFTEIPEKAITSVWVFDNLTAGIEPYEYEYYGSKDASIELAQVFSRFDEVDGSAFFTMKSADGFVKNEALNMVKERYYLKVEGEDAPTNISPYIKLGMNVKNIAWISTNADAAIFPDQLESYMDTKTFSGKTGVPLSEILYEVGVETVETASFDLLGTDGERITVSGLDLKNAILWINPNGGYQVVWDPALKQQSISNLMRVRLSSEQPTPTETDPDEDEAEAAAKPSAGQSGSSSQGTSGSKDVVLTIKGDGVNATTTWSLAELQALDGYKEASYSMVNNWPTRKLFAGKGVTMSALLERAGLKSDAKWFKVTAADGYYATVTKSQLLSSNYYYPSIQQVSASGAGKVPAILAWACNEESGSVSGATDCKLRLLVGQRGVNDVNTDVAVKNVNTIEVMTSAAGSWAQPEAFPAPGRVAAGTEVSFNYDQMDSVKLYYTLDGSTPTLNSSVYNPSTSYFQPELTKPLTINKTTTVKVLVAGWGKNDSSVATYTYTVE